MANGSSVLGINDVSWNNPLADTPFLDTLATNGVILDNTYTLPSCTPSRAAILTGVYPFKMGLQVDTILLSQMNDDIFYLREGLVLTFQMVSP